MPFRSLASIRPAAAAAGRAMAPRRFHAGAVKVQIGEGIQILYDNGVLYAFALAIGASTGSFLNVIIHRWPLGESLVRPGSRCPSCKRPIPWQWNIPVVSWLLLRGRCRWCGARISVRYPLVEAGTGLWAVLMLWKFGPGASAVLYFIFGAGLIAGSVVDLQHMLLPDFITLGLIPVGVGASLLPGRWAPAWPVGPWESLSGAGLGAGLFLLVLVFFKLMTGKEGMGLGDVKLMGAIGAFLGYQAMPAVILIASPAGIAAWAVLARLEMADRDKPVPFGPFLSLGALVVVLAREILEDNWIIIEWV